MLKIEKSKKEGNSPAEIRTSEPTVPRPPFYKKNSPAEIRTLVTRSRTWNPWPLDDGATNAVFYNNPLTAFFCPSFSFLKKRSLRRRGYQVILNSRKFCLETLKKAIMWLDNKLLIWERPQIVWFSWLNKMEKLRI